MKKTSTADRLAAIMKERNLKQVDILRAAKPFCDKYGVKLAKNDLSQYVNGKVEPGQEKLTILGLALNISEAWLMGFDVPMQREAKKEQPIGVDELSADEVNLIMLFRKLPADTRASFPALLEATLKAQGLL